MAYMYFAKVNVNDEIFNVYDDPKVLQTLLVKLMGCINNSTKIDLPKDKGIIKFITIEKDAGKMVVYGRLVKVFKDDIKVYDPKKDDVEDLPTDKLARSATFFFDVEREIVGFTTGQYFGYKQFCSFFELLINACMGKSAFKVFLLKDEELFKEKLKYFNKITKINVIMIPKNPGRSDFECMFANPEALSSTKARYYEQTFRADGKSEIGLSINNDYMDNTIDGVVNGYGDMTVEGIGVNAQKTRITSTADAPARMAIPNVEKNSIPAVVERGIEGIVKVLAKIVRRG